MLSLDELAADKLLALFDRAQARDFIDVQALVERVGLRRMCELAAEKDHGFSPDLLFDMLGSLGRFGAEDLGIDDGGRHALIRSVDQWRQVLSELTQHSRRRPEQPGPGLSI